MSSEWGTAQRLDAGRGGGAAGSHLLRCRTARLGRVSDEPLCSPPAELPLNAASRSMGTGVVSILLHELPYQFRGLGVIANVIFALNVVLFVLFLLATLARYLCFRNMLRLMLLHPAQSLFTGTFPMGLGTIVK